MSPALARSFLVLGLLGCAGDDSAPGDAGGEASEAASEASTGEAEVYPADHAAFPLIENHGGRVLANPKLVTVTFAGDDPSLVNRLQQFDDAITTSDWWAAVTSGYCDKSGACIGVGSGGGHVVAAASDPSYTDSASGGESSLQAFLAQHIAGVGADAGFQPDFPPADANTLYMLYFPENVSITLDGNGSCSSFGGYHNTTWVPDPILGQIAVPYAVIPRCSTRESSNTIAASHEIIEATTDPDIGIGSLTFYMVSNQVWPILGGEVGDLCEFGSSLKVDEEATFWMQRTWSNQNAMAGLDPCAPIPSSEVYFNVAARQPSVVLAAAGQSAVVDLDAFSSGPYPAWTLSARDLGTFQNGPQILSFSFDTKTVENGVHAQLTVTALTPLPQGQDRFEIVSTDPSGSYHAWPMLATTH